MNISSGLKRTQGTVDFRPTTPGAPLRHASTVATDFLEQSNESRSTENEESGYHMEHETCGNDIDLDSDYNFEDPYQNSQKSSPHHNASRRQDHDRTQAKPRVVYEYQTTAVKFAYLDSLEDLCKGASLKEIYTCSAISKTETTCYHLHKIDDTPKTLQEKQSCEDFGVNCDDNDFEKEATDHVACEPRRYQQEQRYLEEGDDEDFLYSALDDHDFRGSHFPPVSAPPEDQYFPPDTAPPEISPEIPSSSRCYHEVDMNNNEDPSLFFPDVKEGDLFYTQQNADLYFEVREAKVRAKALEEQRKKEQEQQQETPLFQPEFARPSSVPFPFEPDPTLSVNGHLYCDGNNNVSLPKGPVPGTAPIAPITPIEPREPLKYPRVLTGRSENWENRRIRRCVTDPQEIPYRPRPPQPPRTPYHYNYTNYYQRPPPTAYNGCNNSYNNAYNNPYNPYQNPYGNNNNYQQPPVVPRDMLINNTNWSPHPFEYALGAVGDTSQGPFRMGVPQDNYKVISNYSPTGRVHCNPASAPLRPPPPPVNNDVGFEFGTTNELGQFVSTETQLHQARTVPDLMNNYGQVNQGQQFPNRVMRDQQLGVNLYAPSQQPPPSFIPNNPQSCFSPGPPPASQKGFPKGVQNGGRYSNNCNFFIYNVNGETRREFQLENNSPIGPLGGKLPMPGPRPCPPCTSRGLRGRPPTFFKPAAVPIPSVGEIRSLLKPFQRCFDL